MSYYANDPDLQIDARCIVDFVTSYEKSHLSVSTTMRTNYDVMGSSIFTMLCTTNGLVIFYSIDKLFSYPYIQIVINALLHVERFKIICLLCHLGGVAVKLIIEYLAKAQFSVLC